MRHNGLLAKDNTRYFGCLKAEKESAQTKVDESMDANLEVRKGPIRLQLCLLCFGCLISLRLGASNGTTKPRVSQVTVRQSLTFLPTHQTGERVFSRVLSTVTELHFPRLHRPAPTCYSSSSRARGLIITQTPTLHHFSLHGSTRSWPSVTSLECEYQDALCESTTGEVPRALP